MSKRLSDSQKIGNMIRHTENMLHKCYEDATIDRIRQAVASLILAYTYIKREENGKLQISKCIVADNRLSANKENNNG